MFHKINQKFYRNEIFSRLFSIFRDEMKEEMVEMGLGGLEEMNEIQEYLELTSTGGF